MNKMKIDLTTGTWQDNPGCPINITSVSTSDAPQGHSGDMGQSDDLVSLLLDVIIDAMDNSSYKLLAFGTTSGLGQEVC